jgi:hypothetical protein
LAITASPDLFCNLDGFVQPGMGQDDRELLAAIPARDVLAGDVLFHGQGHEAQNLIARLVAVRVVELLEMIDVRHQQREPAAALDRVPDDLLERVVEVLAIVKRRQLINQRLIADRLKRGLQSSQCAFLDSSSWLSSFRLDATAFWVDLTRCVT